MKTTKAVREFISRTNTRMKHFTFCFTDDFGDDYATYSVEEAASDFTRRGGKIAKLDVNQLGVKYAQMRGFENCCISIGEGI
jgi:hypothetical protein